MSKKDPIPSVIILDVNFAGYGIIRSLYGLGIKLIGFCDARVPTPEVHSRLLDEVISFSNEKELLMLLKEFRHYNIPPVLFLNTDYYVEFFSNNIQSLKDIFNICMPNQNILNTCLSKVKFSEFAKENKLSIPKYRTLEVKDSEFTNHYIEELNFPLVIKPFLRDAKWNESGYPKVFYCNNNNEYEELIKKALEKTKSIIVQEYIPGEDSEIYFCLVYYNNNSQCIGSFCGKKLTQYPPGLGSTASATKVDISELEIETRKIFDILKIVGFASMEYKRNLADGKFYIMEPTIGRLNLQEYVATANGFNLPLIAYNSLTCNNLQNKVNIKHKKVIYIDEWAHLKSLLKQKNGLFNYLKALKSIKPSGFSFRYFNFSDPLVFIYSFYIITKQYLKVGLKK